ncbi:MAG: hypothetical protein LLG20_17190 [Acidobacteriales bacterium]|nr:hypothetical protein [Terriglobales bacterium]
MTFSNACLFNKTADQCRKVGARGGRARARNLRLRHAARTATPPPAPPETEEDRETAHEASALLDEQFPHLRTAFAPRQTTREQLLRLLRQPGGASTDQMVVALGLDRQYVCRSFRSIAGQAVQISRLVRADGTRAYVAR